MNFVRFVRDRRVPAPPQKAFAEAAWRDAFSSNSDGSDEDEKLYAAGLWFAERFASARQAWEELPRLERPPLELVRLFVGALNFQCHGAKWKSSDAFQVINLRGASTVAEFTLPNAFFAEQIQGLISGAKVALTNARRGVEPTGRPVASHTQECILSGLRQRSCLGNQYDGLETLWSECLWNEWYVDASGEGDIVRPGSMERENWRAVSSFRRDMLQLEMAATLESVWRRQAAELSRALLAEPVIVGVRKESRHKSFVLGAPLFDERRPPLELMHQLAATELYFNELLSLPLPLLGGVTIRQVLAARWLISPLANCMREAFPPVRAVVQAGTLLQYAPTFRYADLKSAVLKGTDLSTHQADLVLNLLSFEGTGREESWLRPLIALGSDTFSVLVAPLESPNLLWAIDVWMNEGGIDLSRRGPAFEAVVRSELCGRCKLACAEVWPSPVRLSDSASMEEIDLVLRIGNTVLIGEVKCTVYPTEPFHMHTYEGILLSAAEQATRKADFVRNHLDDLLCTTGWTSIDVANVTVSPFVLTNLPLGPGLASCTVPITDLQILGRFLDEGYLDQFVIESAAGVRDVGQRVVFYESDEQAPAEVYSYLVSPPALAPLWEHITEELRPLYHFDGERPAAFVAVNVRLPDELDISASGTSQGVTRPE